VAGPLNRCQRLVKHRGAAVRPGRCRQFEPRAAASCASGLFCRPGRTCSRKRARGPSERIRVVASRRRAAIRWSAPPPARVGQIVDAQPNAYSRKVLADVATPRDELGGAGRGILATARIASRRTGMLVSNRSASRSTGASSGVCQRRRRAWPPPGPGHRGIERPDQEPVRPHQCLIHHRAWSRPCRTFAS